MVKIRLFNHHQPHKTLTVQKGHLALIHIVADQNDMTIEQAADLLLRHGLIIETGIDVNHYRTPKEVVEALQQQQQQPSEEHKTIFVTLQIPKRNRAFITVSPVLHAAVAEYARQRKLTYVETAIIWLQKAFTVWMKHQPHAQDMEFPTIRSRDDLRKIL